MSGIPLCLSAEVEKHKSANRLQSLGQNKILLDANHFLTTDIGVQIQNLCSFHEEWCVNSACAQARVQTH